ncbi:hypothetical protein K1F50_20140 [Muricauda oceani]|uniref:Uncharacterized protein n=1 Tax=Flagellimonas oceani TaxID=2698672 RepID=A0A6G7J031_9FLAO|nr:hypothetical protein [Allomuricauda oceani]MBW8245127.1 hypothetical protein [Allomuricauda oceani]QII44213.1 hypothetical protein GVT53_05835 [Allomuricauda oceani]
MLKIFKNSSPTPSLHQLDRLYGQAICKCPLQEQISYCQRLIESSEYHLGQSCPKKDSTRLKQLIKAAGTELKRLHSQVSSQRS